FFGELDRVKVAESVNIKTDFPSPRPSRSEGVKKWATGLKTASSPQPSPPKEEREKNRTEFFHSFSGRRGIAARWSANRESLQTSWIALCCSLSLREKAASHHCHHRGSTPETNGPRVPIPYRDSRSGACNSRLREWALYMALGL